jgi:E3 ubiquitin-protein ligase HUWE1
MNAEIGTSGVPEPNVIIPDEPIASSSGTQPAPSTAPARIVVMYQGQEVDITDADIDPEFLQAVPEDIRDEIIGNYVREQQRQARPSRPAEAEMDMDFLNALPADIREDVLRGQAAQITGVPAEMDAASVLATLPEELRQTVLLEQDDGTLQALPSSVIAEVNALRAQQQSRRMPASMLQPDRELNPPLPRKQPPHREAVQLLDKSGIANLVRLLFYTDTNRRTALQQVLVNLSENSKSRSDLLTLLLVMLQGGKNDIGGVDKIFSQLSVRSSAKAHSSGKGKHKEIDSHPATASTASTASTLPDEVVVQRSLDTLTAIVNANEPASLYFLTEQELPHSLQRSPSKKGKGKERQEPPRIIHLYNFSLSLNVIIYFNNLTCLTPSLVSCAQLRSRLQSCARSRMTHQKTSRNKKSLLSNHRLLKFLLSRLKRLPLSSPSSPPRQSFSQQRRQ